MELPHCLKEKFPLSKATFGFPLQKLFCTLLYLPPHLRLYKISAFLLPLEVPNTVGLCAIDNSNSLFSDLPRLEAPVFWLFQAFLFSRSAPLKNRVGAFGNRYPLNSVQVACRLPGALGAPLLCDPPPPRAFVVTSSRMCMYTSVPPTGEPQHFFPSGPLCPAGGEGAPCTN